MKLALCLNIEPGMDHESLMLMAREARKLAYLFEACAEQGAVPQLLFNNYGDGGIVATFMIEAGENAGDWARYLEQKVAQERGG